MKRHGFILWLVWLSLALALAPAAVDPARALQEMSEIEALIELAQRRQAAEQRRLLEASRSLQTVNQNLERKSGLDKEGEQFLKNYEARARAGLETAQRDRSAASASVQAERSALALTGTRLAVESAGRQSSDASLLALGLLHELHASRARIAAQRVQDQDARRGELENKRDRAQDAAAYQSIFAEYSLEQLRARHRELAHEVAAAQAGADQGLTDIGQLAGRHEELKKLVTQLAGQGMAGEVMEQPTPVVATITTLPSPTPSPTPLKAVVPPVPSPTALPVLSPTPSPTPSTTPSPTPSPTPTPTPSPTLTPTPMPTPVEATPSMPSMPSMPSTTPTPVPTPVEATATPVPTPPLVVAAATPSPSPTSAVTGHPALPANNIMPGTDEAVRDPGKSAIRNPQSAIPGTDEAVRDPGNSAIRNPQSAIPGTDEAVRAPGNSAIRNPQSAIPGTDEAVRDPGNSAIRNPQSAIPEVPYEEGSEPMASAETEGGQTAGTRTLFWRARPAGVCALGAGKVLFSGAFAGYRHLLIIDHGGGWRTIYGNLAQCALQAGDKVTRDQSVGTYQAEQGGRAEPLWFEVRQGAQAVVPEAWPALPKDWHLRILAQLEK